MRLVKEMSIKDFKPWGGALDMYEKLSDNDLEILDYYFKELGESVLLDEITVNDMLWFDDEYLITEVLEKEYDEFYA